MMEEKEIAISIIERDILLDSINKRNRLKLELEKSNEEYSNYLKLVFSSKGFPVPSGKIIIEEDKIKFEILR